MSDQYILLIETSSEYCSVAIANHEEVIASASELVGTNHISHLTLMIQGCLEQAKIGVMQLSAVAVSDGPGSYTALRIGASTAKGICYACSLPLIAVNTSKALAMAVAIDTDARQIIPLIDARRMEAYCSIYNRELQLVLPPNNLIFDENNIETLIPSGSILCGNAAPKVFALVGTDRNIQLSPIQHCEAHHLIPLAAAAYQQKDFSDLSSYNPTYFKAPNITTSKKNII